MPHLAVVRNTLLPAGSIDKILSLPRPDEALASLRESLTRFQGIKDFASEVQTEKQLIRPMLRVLGYVFEARPKFFEEHVKEPDFVLFPSEEERVQASRSWGTDRYFTNALALVAAKRYGRNLDEGITGFYLEFESRIPIFQMMYLLRKSRVNWGIVTNGKNWTLLQKPVAAEKRIFEMDLETGLSMDPDGTLSLFFHVFSLSGMTSSVPDMIESGHSQLARFLTEQRARAAEELQEDRRKVEVYPRLVKLYSSIFPGQPLPLTQAYLEERAISCSTALPRAPLSPDPYDESDIFDYLLTKDRNSGNIDLEDILLKDRSDIHTKEGLFDLKVLDMTPGFGVTATQLVEGIAFLSLLLPYQEKNSVVSEWERGPSLYRSILDNMLYGTEKSHPALDILQHALYSRFGTAGKNYLLGNPLLGLSLRDMKPLIDTKNQVTLFARPPGEVIADLRDTYKRCSELSDRIREDAQLKEELRSGMVRSMERIRDVLDVVTAGYFIKLGDGRKIKELLNNLDSTEQTWEEFRSSDWFIAAKHLARRNNFFHMELEFPFLLYRKFDLIFIHSSQSYLWDDRIPLSEIGKAYIKRGLSYLKQEGRIVLLAAHESNELLSEIRKAKKYQVEMRETCAVIRRR